MIYIIAHLTDNEIVREDYRPVAFTDYASASRYIRDNYPDVIHSEYRVIASEDENKYPTFWSLYGEALKNKTSFEWPPKHDR